MSFKATEEQKEAIYSKGNILVSAAAGSGKTAVLVERFIRLITDEQSPVMADRILVVTFTNAAAAELKLRIEKRLNQVIAESPYNPFLQRQKILLSCAKICTIDSFCIDFIRENFQIADVDPSFKIAENSVIKMLMASAMSQLLNEEFNSENAQFLSLLEYIGCTYDDAQLAERIRDIYEYSRQMPFPDEWLNRVLQSYKDNANGKTEQWFCDAFTILKDYAQEAKSFIDRGICTLQNDSEVWEKYSENFNYFSDFIEQIQIFCDAEDWDGIFSLGSSLKPPALKKITADQKRENVIWAVSQRDEAKEIIKKILSFVYADRQTIRNEICFSVAHISKIVELVIRFEKIFYTSLAERGLMTFYMAEQTALSLISEYKDGEVVAAANAGEFISAFDAVLVDEYQDTNDLQDCIFNILSNNQRNLFCVGDSKQSIYRFRGANPHNFIEKKKLYTHSSEENGFGRRIDLTANFRSRAEVCEGVNRLFGLIMHENNAEIEYDDKEKLVPLGSFPENNETKVEHHFIDMKKLLQSDEGGKLGSQKTKQKAEAAVIAELIQKTVKAPAFIKDGEGLRPAKYSDIVILLRSPSSTAELIGNELRKRNIPISIPSGNIFGSDEVNTVISLLKIINNPFDDIALLTVMTSPLYCFSIDELAQMRALSKKGRLISALSMAANNGNSKAESFLRELSHYREVSVVLKVYDLINEIFEATNYLGLVSRQEDGERRKSNLSAIKNLAQTFEAEGKRSLREFLKSIESMSDSDIKTESFMAADSVKIMSIHSSKGLQFPVVILADTNHRFNFSDCTAPLLIDSKYGFAFKYYDKENKEKSNTLLRAVMAEHEKGELLSEEVRLLYVALTRAEEKLITTTCFDDLKKRISSLSDFGFINDGAISPYFFAKTSCYADWLIADEFAFCPERYLDYLDSDTLCDQIHTKLEKADKTEALDVEANAQLAKAMRSHYTYTYPYAELLRIESKASVTDIVHKADGIKYQFTARPDFMNEKGMSSAKKGTATHKFMQFCDYEKAAESVKEESERLYEQGFLTYEESKVVDEAAVKRFFDSELYRRISSSDMVKKEMNFLSEFPVSFIYPDMANSIADEDIVIQGAVDLLFEEDDGIVIVDFKTDRNKSQQDLRESYAEQLKIYGKACEKLMKKPVKQLILYSFSIGAEVVI